MAPPNNKKSRSKGEPPNTKNSKPKTHKMILEQVPMAALKREVSSREAAKKAAKKKSPQGRANIGKTKMILSHNS